MTRRNSILAVFAALLFTLSLSTAASAQSNDPWWGRNDDRRDRDRDRDRDRRRDDGYYNRDRYGRYDDRELRDAAQRIKDRSHDLERDVDRFLDNSRVNGTRREDHINSDIHDFRRAADNFKSRVGNGRDLNRSANEARELLGTGEHAEQMLSRLRVDSRTYADWREIDQDLRLVADIYGLNYRGGYNDGYRRGGYDPRYPDNRYPNRNDNWWRRLPDIINGRRP
jgi:hypothetical protein